jgi:GTP-binding protein HflX
LSGEGIDLLLAEIDRRLARRRHIDEIEIDLADGKALAAIYRHGRVLSRVDEDGMAHIRVERRTV